MPFRRFAAIAAVLATAGITALWAGPAGASIVPLVDCAARTGPDVYTVYFGYSNSGPRTTIPVGDNNQVLPGVQNQGQPTVFNTGTYPRVFRALLNTAFFNGVVWIVDGTEAFMPNSDVTTTGACGGPLLAPAIGTVPRVGEPVVASLGTWVGVVRGQLKAVWQRSADGKTWEDIGTPVVAALMTTSYTPVAQDVGDLLRVHVTATGLLAAPDDPSVSDSPASAAVKGPTGPLAVLDQAQVFGGPNAVVGITLHGERATFTGAPAGTTYTELWQSRPNATTPWSQVATGLTLVVPRVLLGSQLRFAHVADDGEGNAVTAASSPLDVVDSDTLAPKTTLSPAPAHPDGTNGWYKSAPSVSAAGDDAGGSGVATTLCALDPATVPGGFGDLLNLGAPASCPSLTSKGTHVFYAASRDAAGNTESPAASLTIKLDSAAPVLSLPASIVADATSPAGAIATFVASAADATSGPASQTASCTPAAGARFPIGDTTVHCSALDQAGNAGIGTFTVHVKGAAEQLAALRTATIALRPQILANTLTALLDDAGRNPQRACSDLAGYQAVLQGAASLGIPTGSLGADAGRIRAVLACAGAR